MGKKKKKGKGGKKKKRKKGKKKKEMAPATYNIPVYKTPEEESPKI